MKLFQHVKEERDKRKQEWHRVERLEADVRRIETEMRAIQDYVHAQPTLRRAK